MDTTYFGRSFGIMVLYDSISKKPLYVEEVKYETNVLYQQAICSLQQKGLKIQSIVCDGRKGLVQLFDDIPVQLCQFHQVKTVNTYLTRRPKTEAAQTLRQLALELKNSSRSSFQTALATWFECHGTFMNERTINAETGKSFYTHKRLRSAYFSLKRNLPHLFVFEDFAALGINTTTNLLDGRFADLKLKLRCHQGMKKENKIRFIKDYFSKLASE